MYQVWFQEAVWSDFHFRSSQARIWGSWDRNYTDNFPSVYTWLLSRAFCNNPGILRLHNFFVTYYFKYLLLVISSSESVQKHFLRCCPKSKLVQTYISLLASKWSCWLQWKDSSWLHGKLNQVSNEGCKLSVGSVIQKFRDLSRSVEYVKSPRLLHCARTNATIRVLEMRMWQD